MNYVILLCKIALACMYVVRINLYGFTSWNPGVPSKFSKYCPNLIIPIVPVGVPISLALRYTWTFMRTCRDF